ncbi:hypothetical protein U3516DRAFT_743429 [Neocallimastix sp. 'constans']
MHHILSIFIRNLPIRKVLNNTNETVTVSEDEVKSRELKLDSIDPHGHNDKKEKKRKER